MDPRYLAAKQNWSIITLVSQYNLGIILGPSKDLFVYYWLCWVFVVLQAFLWSW